MPIGYVLLPRYGLITGGSSLLGTLYFTHVLLTLSTGDIGAWPLLVPVIGPFIEAGILGRDGLSGRDPLGYLLIVDGLIQAGGLAMILTGAMLKKRTPIYSEGFMLTPFASTTWGGLVAAGRF